MEKRREERMNEEEVGVVGRDGVFHCQQIMGSHNRPTKIDLSLSRK
jgi:hypothetical protein